MTSERRPRARLASPLPAANALRHGRRAITHRHPTPSSEIERFAKAICGADNDPLLFSRPVSSLRTTSY
jgi:hypothetical protein